MTYIINIDYAHKSFLSCYANNNLVFRINLSDSLICTKIYEHYGNIAIYKRSQKHKLNEECVFFIDNDCEYIVLPFGSSIGKEYNFNDFIKIIQGYNNIKGGE